MNDDKKKYSIWLVPKDQSAEQIKALVSELSENYNAPNFIPHITLVAKNFVNSEELVDVKNKINKLTELFKAFSIKLSQYGYKDETHRCLYLLAESPELSDLYIHATDYFPQIKQEHFEEMPHMSIMYGDYDEQTKQQIIASHKLEPITFRLESIDLYLTEGSESDWREVYSSKLLQ